MCGVVLMWHIFPENHDELNRLSEDTVVVSAEPVPELGLPHVTVNRGGGAETAVQHLLSLGHRRIAAIKGFGGQADRDFCDGYHRGLTGEGVPFDPKLVLELERGRSNLEEGERTIERWFHRLATVTAPVTTDDEVAIGVIRALQRRGQRVPEDIAVIGFDDLPVAAYVEPPLTTLAQPAEEQGSRLAKLFLKRMKAPHQITDYQVALPTRLVVRESCGARRQR